MQRYNGHITIVRWNQLVTYLEDNVEFKNQFHYDLCNLNTNQGFLKDFLQEQRPTQLDLVQKIFPNYEDINTELAEKIILTDISDVTVEYLRKNQPDLFNIIEMWYVERILSKANLWNDDLRNFFEQI